MKKLLIITIALFTFSFQTIAHAKTVDNGVIDDSVSNYISNNSSKISWHYVNDFKVASFIKDGYRMKAFYNEQGELVTITRTLKSRDELSQKALANLDKSYPGWGMTSLFEEKGLENNVVYYATMTDGDRSVIVRINALGKIRRF